MAVQVSTASAISDEAKGQGEHCKSTAPRRLRCSTALMHIAPHLHMCPTGQLDSFCHTALGRTAYEMNRQETGVNLGIAVPWLHITELGSNVQDGLL